MNKNKNDRKGVILQNIMGRTLEDIFGVMVEDEIDTNIYFEDNTEEISREHYDLQFQIGYSLNQSKKIKPKKIFEGDK